MVKNPSVHVEDAGDVGSIPGLGRYPGGGNSKPLHYSCWEKSHGLRSLEAIVIGSQRISHDFLEGSFPLCSGSPGLLEWGWREPGSSSGESSEKGYDDFYVSLNSNRKDLCRWSRDQAPSLWSGSTDSKILDYQRTNPKDYKIVRTHTNETTWIQNPASPNHQ